MSNAQPPLLCARGVSVRFGGVAAVQDVDLDVFDGEIVSLIGPNGAGKTTTVHALTGFVRPTSGSILFNGTELIGSRAEAIAAMGLVRTFQNAAMFSSMTVRDNLATGAFLRSSYSAWSVLARTRAFRDLEDASHKRVTEVLHLIGLEQRKDLVSGQLPYGEQRILGVGIALMTSPNLVVLDEPAAGLSPSEAQTMAALIRTIHASGTTILLIEHNMSVVMTVSDRIVVLKQGQVLAEGTPAYVREHPEVVAAYLGSDA